MSIWTFCPMISSAVYPKRRSAAGLNDSTMPRSSMVMIPSTAVCRMACVRASLSRSPASACWWTTTRSSCCWCSAPSATCNACNETCKASSISSSAPGPWAGLATTDCRDATCCCKASMWWCTCWAGMLAVAPHFPRVIVARHNRTVNVEHSQHVARRRGYSEATMTPHLEASPPAYVPRDPSQTVLYRVVPDHLETSLASLDADPNAKGLPAYVEHELYDYLQCGTLMHGFLRLGCDLCQHELLLAFSCKRRGFGPSCAGRRIAQ